MIGLYRPGHSPLHGSPAWLKLATLAALALAISFAGSSWPGIAAGWVLVIAGYLVAGLGLTELVRQVLHARWLVVVLAVTQLAFLPIPDALTGTLRVLAVVVLAALLTLTTRMSELLDALQAAIAPTARLGVPTRAIALTIALTITTIPVLASLAAQLREAQIARTGSLRLGAFVVPLLVLALKHADGLADALRARGLD